MVPTSLIILHYTNTTSSPTCTYSDPEPVCLTKRHPLSDRRTKTLSDHLSVPLSQFLTKKHFQITHPGSINYFPRKLHLKTQVHKHSLTPKNSIKTPQQYAFSKNPHTEPPSTQPTYHPYFTPYNTTFTHPTPDTSHAWAIPGPVGDHTGHPVLVIKDVFTSGSKSRWILASICSQGLRRDYHLSRSHILYLPFNYRQHLELVRYSITISSIHTNFSAKIIATKYS